jgi:hypothetical protein
MMEFHEEIGGGGSQRRGWCMDPIHDTPALAISPSHIPCPACPKFRKNDWDRITFFYNSKLNFYFILFCFKDTTLFYLSKLPKNLFWNFGPLKDKIYESLKVTGICLTPKRQWQPKRLFALLGKLP